MPGTTLSEKYEAARRFGFDALELSERPAFDEARAAIRAGIPVTAIDAFDEALTSADVEHRFVVYDGAPHSFFDRKATEFADASAAAWEELLAFVRGHTPSLVG